MPEISCIIAELESLTAHDPIDGDEDRSSLLSVFGKQLKTVELADSTIVSGDIVHDVRSIFQRCPDLHTFSFPVFPTVLPPETGVLHPSLSVITLRITSTTGIGDNCERFLRAHIKTIMGDAFPALRRIELHVMEGSSRQFYPACRDLLRRFLLVGVKGTVTVWSRAS
jgi:hypothetical protein